MNAICFCDIIGKGREEGKVEEIEKVERQKR
jgi:hypothetical protein